MEIMEGEIPPVSPVESNPGVSDSVYQAGAPKSKELMEKSLRSKFLKGVYIVQVFRTLMFMLVGIIYSQLEHNETVVRKLSYKLLPITGMIGVFSILIAICIPDLMFTSPFNYFFGILITLVECGLVVCSIITYSYHEVVIVMGIACAMYIVFVILSFQPILVPSPMLKVIALVLVIVAGSPVMLTHYEHNIVVKVFSLFLNFIYGVYVIYDTNLMVSGKHTIDYGDNDYFQGAIDIVLDVFRYILYSIVGFLEYLISKISS